MKFIIFVLLIGGAIASFASGDEHPKETQKCYGPRKCGKHGFCVGFEGGNVYCYGSISGCIWDTRDCIVDGDCSKYSTSSPKYTDGGEASCTAPPSGWRGDACTCGLTGAIQEVKFENGMVGCSSVYDTKGGGAPSHAFRPASNLYWQSGRDSVGNGELAAPFPHMIFYDFKTTSIIPARVSFRSGYAGSGCEAKAGWCGASKYQFVGSNDRPCNKWSRWTVLCEDLSGEFFKSKTQSKYCNVSVEKRDSFRCLGISVLEAPYTGYITVSMAGIRMWKMT